jgi:hypothetical protein
MVNGANLTGDGCDCYSGNPDDDYIPIYIGQTPAYSGSEGFNPASVEVVDIELVDLWPEFPHSVYKFYIDLTDPQFPKLACPPLGANQPINPSFPHILIGTAAFAQDGKLINVRQIVRADIVDSNVGNVSNDLWYQVTELHDRYLTCRKWDGNEASDTDVLVAKQSRFRTTFTSEKIDGITINFTYDDTDPNNVRTANDGVVTVQEKCHPRFTTTMPANDNQVPSNLIYVKRVDHTGVVVDGITLNNTTVHDMELTLLDDTHRVWAAQQTVSNT